MYPSTTRYGGAYRKRCKKCYPNFRQRDISQTDRKMERMGGNLDPDQTFLQTLKDTYKNAVKVKFLDFSRVLDWKSTIKAIDRLGFVEPSLVESPCPDIEGKAKVGAPLCHRQSPGPQNPHRHHPGTLHRHLCAGASGRLGAQPGLPRRRRRRTALIRRRSHPARTIHRQAPHRTQRPRPGHGNRRRKTGRIDRPDRGIPEKEIGLTGRGYHGII